MGIMTEVNCWAAVSLHLFVIFLAMQLSCGQEDYQPGRPPHYDNQPPPDHYGYGDTDYSDYAYNVNGQEKEKHLCYSCHFTAKGGHNQGFENCRDPFDSSGIPQVECEGPCSKRYHKLGEKEFEVLRQCTPNCKEFMETNYYVECCSSGLCNGAQGSQARNHVTGHLVSITTAICLVLIFQLR